MLLKNGITVNLIVLPANHFLTFQRSGYPKNVRSTFTFMRRFFILDVSIANANILAPEVYEREKDQFIKTMEEASELAIHFLRELIFHHEG